MKIRQEIPDLFTIEQKFRHCTWRIKCIILLPAH